jgi:hypothetical protein
VLVSGEIRLGRCFRNALDVYGQRHPRSITTPESSWRSLSEWRQNLEGRAVSRGGVAPLLWAQGEGQAAMELENLWDIAKSQNVDLLCGYLLGSFRGGDYRVLVKQPRWFGVLPT